MHPKAKPYLHLSFHRCLYVSSERVSDTKGTNKVYTGVCECVEQSNACCWFVVVVIYCTPLIISPSLGSA